MPFPITFKHLSLALVLGAFVLSPMGLLAQTEPSGKALPVGEKPSGNVSMEFGQGGFILSASGGNGTLVFQGRLYTFKLGSLGVGGFGVSKVKATGDVFNLSRIEDFPGAFFQARAGYAAVDGKGHLWLENTHGVVLKLKAVTKGLALNLGADGLLVEMNTKKSSAVPNQNKSGKNAGSKNTAQTSTANKKK